MSELAGDILSREELDAILSSFEPGEAQPPRREGAANQAWRALPITRALREYAEYHARSLSTVYQRPIRFDLLSIDSVPAGDFAAAMLDDDLPALIEFQPRGVSGALLIGRTMSFGWLAMAYGAPVGSPLFVPDRPYSPIEMRFLRQCALQLVSTLGRGLGLDPAPTVRVSELIEPSLLADVTAPRLRVASFAVDGFGDVARLRIAIPEELCGEANPRRLGAGQSQNHELEDQLLEVPISLRAEIGWADIGLHAVSELAVGDVIELESRPRHQIVVSLEGEAKFHAERGRSGERAAIRITEQL